MLTLLTLCYLALPYFLFAWGWLWWPYAALLTAALFAALAIARKVVLARNGEPETSRFWVSNRDGILALLLTLVISLPSGFGGIGYQREDWRKHNAVLHDLATNSWPVVLISNDDGSPSSYLAYYVAYYLPAATVGRVCGLTAAHLTLFVWTFFGLLLCARRISKLVPKWAPLAWAVWFALAGMDVVFGAILRGNFGDWWAEYWQYSANYSLLIWVPQHRLVATYVVARRTADRLPLGVQRVSGQKLGLPVTSFSPATRIFQGVGRCFDYRSFERENPPACWQSG